MPLTILVTGGAGYVGSHTTLELLIVGHSVVCVDNLSNAFKDGNALLPEAIRRVQNITGQQIIFYPVDIRDGAGLKNIFKKNSTMPLTILVTGGAGYVGSHTTLELLIVGHSVVCVDNLSNAFKDGNALLPEAIRRVQNITGQQIIFYPVDIRDGAGLKNIFKKHKIDCVAHFAALKAVGESCRQPLQYYQKNISGTGMLLEAMAEAEFFNLYIAPVLRFMVKQNFYQSPNLTPLVIARTHTGKVNILSRKF